MYVLETHCVLPWRSCHKWRYPTIPKEDQPSDQLSSQVCASRKGLDGMNAWSCSQSPLVNPFTLLVWMLAVWTISASTDRFDIGPSSYCVPHWFWWICWRACCQTFWCMAASLHECQESTSKAEVMHSITRKVIAIACWRSRHGSHVKAGTRQDLEVCPSILWTTGCWNYTYQCRGSTVESTNSPHHPCVAKPYACVIRWLMMLVWVTDRSPPGVLNRR